MRARSVRGRFLSECAIAGAPPLSSLLKMMTPADVGDEAAAMWEFRTKDNPYNGEDVLTHYRMLERTARQLFGESGEGEPARKVKTMEYVQYELARLHGEPCRRRKYASSGLLFWMYNDCWPASGWALVDYFGVPKAGYYGAKKAFRPLMISLEDRRRDIGVWMVNDTLAPRSGEIAIRSARTGGATLFAKRCRATVPAHVSILVDVLTKEDIAMAAGARDVVLQAVWRPDPAREEAGEPEPSEGDWAFWFDVMPKELELPKATLQVTCVPYDERSGVIEIGTDVYARVVTIEEEVEVDDNYFDMMPGDIRKIAYKTKSPIPWTAAPKVTCWNG